MKTLNDTQVVLTDLLGKMTLWGNSRLRWSNVVGNSNGVRRLDIWNVGYPSEVSWEDVVVTYDFLKYGLLINTRPNVNT